MSLVDPTIQSFWQKYRFWIILGGCVLALILIAGLFSWGSNWWFWRGVENDKEAIKEELANIKVAEETIANLKIDIAVAKERVAEGTNNYANAVNATDAAKAQTNAALANLQQAKDANAINVSVAELERKLDALDQ